MQEQTLTLPHDIKPLVEIQDYTVYFVAALGIVALIVAAGLLYLSLHWWKNKKRENIRKKHLRLLREVDLNDTKKAAYALTKYGATFKDDDERHMQMYANLLEKLQRYKYKKEVERFDKETLSIINLYREICDV